MADLGSASGMRSVVRAACLNCRSAKRRCDGVQPVCGPCMSRGIEEGGCNFVSSKRGGPRYKGVRGAEAARVKAEREREREELRAAREGGSGGSGGSGHASSSKRDRESSHYTGTNSHSDHSSPDHHRIGPEASSPDPFMMQQHGHAPAYYTGNDGNAPRIISRRSWIDPGSSSGSTGIGANPAFVGNRPLGHQRGASYTGPTPSIVPVGTQPPADPYMTALQQTQDLFPEQQLHYQLLAQQNQQMILQQTAPLSPHHVPMAPPQPPHSVAMSMASSAAPQHQSMLYPSQSQDTVLHKPGQIITHTPAPTQNAQASLNALLGIDYNDIVSLANLEVSPAQGRHNPTLASPHVSNHDDASALGIGGAQEFSEFLASLELLPKAGNIGACGDGPSDPLEVLMDWEGGEVGQNVQDNEQGARTLLTDFYNLVYPSCPVLPSPGSLPSLAFYFSGKGPCGLFAALSAVVALHLNSDEALRTLKASQHPLQRYEACPRVPDGDQADWVPETKSAEDVAAYHAKTSEYILHQWEEKQRTCFMDLSAANPFDGLDEELITIEAGAAHTLLCHYHYGSNKPLSHQRAYKHAVEAWNLMQRLDIPSRTAWQQDGSERANPARPFAADLKLEWAKRVYWASYASATVMSCTGGFTPFGSPRDGVMDLKLRPSLDHDVSAWGVMVRGAQQVSKCYRLLYDLDLLRSRVMERDTPLSPAEMQQVAMERQSIFTAMLKLDAEISTYTRFDAGWRDVTQAALNETARTPGGSAWPPTPGSAPGQMMSGDSKSSAQGDEVSTADRELARSLKVAGRLMTSGAIILLHRAQAFSNARVFMAPQCGVPQATRANKVRRMEPLVHRDEATKLEEGDAKSEFAGMAPSSRNGSSITTHSTESHSTSTSSSNGSFANDQSFLTDRFAGGPFEPSHSLERCRFAASTMVSTLPRVLQDIGRVPKLPPYSACSYVLGAYAILMLTLLLQVRSDRAWQQQQQHQVLHHERQQSEASDNTNLFSNDSAVQARKSMLRGQLETQRAPVRDMIAALSKFAVVWPKAVEYAREVSTLLQANETIG